MNEIRIRDPKSGEILARITDEGTEINEAWEKASDIKKDVEEVKEIDERKED